MRHWLTWLTSVNSHTAQSQRQGRNTIILVMGLIALTLVFVALSLFQAGTGSTYITLGVALALFTTTLFVTRRGYVTLGGILLTASLIVVVLGSMIMTRTV